MSTKASFTLIAALVVASASTAFAQSDRQNTIALNSNQYSQGYGRSEAIAINNRGQVVGDYNNSSGGHGFLYSGGKYTTIDDPLP